MKNDNKEREFVVIYERELFPGIIIDKDDNGNVVKTMSMGGNNWKWPEKDDIMTYTDIYY